MRKLLRVLLFFTIIIWLGFFMFVYAYLPKDVILLPDQLTVTKDNFFYIAITLFLVVNFLFTIVAGMFKQLKSARSTQRSQDLRTWFVSLPIMINLYLAFSIGSLGVMNNPSNFEGSFYGYLNYLGPILLVGWIFVLIFILAKGNQTTSESTN